MKPQCIQESKQPQRLMQWLPLVALVVASLLVGCNEPRSPITYPQDLPPLQDVRDQLPTGASKAILLPHGLDALSARVRLLRSAQKSVDMQYYIWHPDYAGQILLHEVLLAAERGVTIRLLVDGLGAKDCFDHLRKLAVHENVTVQIYNHMGTGLGKISDVFYIDTLQRRMHNKLIIVDQIHLLTGGRNIGDEYFWTNADLAFIDVDVAAHGPVVADAQAVFERYWSSQHVTPIDKLFAPLKQKSYDKLRKDLSQLEAPVELAERLNKALSEDALLNIRSEKSGPFIAPMRFFADQPEKTNKSLTPEERYPLRLGYQLDHYFRQRGPVQHLEIANAYFILEDEQIANLDEIIRSGGKVRILTNSLMATDVPMVHAAYAPNRRRLVDIGVDLWELRAYIVQKSASYGHEILGLHGKIMVVNDRYAIIGSANLDPRSRELNTEVALIIDHSDAADGMQELMNQLCAPEVSYQVTADPESETGLIWRWIESGEEQQTTDEPHRNAWRSLLQGTYHLMVPKSML